MRIYSIIVPPRALFTNSTIASGSPSRHLFASSGSASLISGQLGSLSFFSIPYTLCAIKDSPTVQIMKKFTALFIVILVSLTIFNLKSTRSGGEVFEVIADEKISPIKLLVKDDFGSIKSNLWKLSSSSITSKTNNLRKFLELNSSLWENELNLGYRSADGLASLSVDNSKLGLWQYSNLTPECDISLKTDCYNNNPSKILSLAYAQKLIKVTTGSYDTFDFSFEDGEKLLKISATKVIADTSTPLTWEFFFGEFDSKLLLISAYGFLASLDKGPMVKTLSSAETAEYLSQRSNYISGKIFKAEFKRSLSLVYAKDGTIWLAPSYTFLVNKVILTELALPDTVAKRVTS